MSDIDEEVLRAEQMALAFASAPKMRVKDAKKIVSRSQTNSPMNISIHKTSIHKTERKSGRRSPRNREISPTPPVKIMEAPPADEEADEEVRRAREMALAVAALGTEKGAMKAEEIRMAIADCVSDPNEKSRKEKKKQQSTDDRMEASPRKKQQGNGQTPQSEFDENPNDFHLQTIMEELLRPPWILRNQSVFLTVVLANMLILYVALSSAPCYTKLSNAVFIFNTAVSFFCVVEKRDPENMAIESAMEVADDEENKKKQEALVVEMEKRIRPEKSITLEWLPDVQYSEVDLQSLLDLQPESTLAERRRFLKARKGVIKAASAQLGSYIEWRSKNKIDEFFPSTFTTDEEDWALASRGALEIANTSRKSPASDKVLPRIVSVYGGSDGLVLCKNGARIVHVLPSQLNTTIAPATTYALSLAMYLDRKLDRKFTEKVTVVIDIRSGKGWPNPSSVSLVPFIKLVVGSLNSYFPERLSRCILFPLPMTATVIFNKAKGKTVVDVPSYRLSRFICYSLLTFVTSFLNG